MRWNGGRRQPATRSAWRPSRRPTPWRTGGNLAMHLPRPPPRRPAIRRSCSAHEGSERPPMPGARCTRDSRP
eukprot:scaffold176669_cov28-Tisochrysis_lutea.AAC.2